MPRPSAWRSVGFHDQVRVVALQRVVHEPKLAALAAAREGPLDLPHQPHRAQRRNVLADLQRDVTRQARGRTARGSGVACADSGPACAQPRAVDRPSGRDRRSSCSGLSPHGIMIGAIFCYVKTVSPKSVAEDPFETRRTALRALEDSPEVAYPGRNQLRRRIGERSERNPPEARTGGIRTVCARRISAVRP